MSQADLKVELRENTGHTSAKALRQSGRVPSIYYFHNDAPIPLSLDAKQLKRIVNSEINILNVVFPDGKAKKSVFREIQKDPVTDNIIHVDLMGIKLTEKVRLTIPILLKGTPIGVKDQGGILEHLLREVMVEGLPLEIPDHIEMDVSHLNIGDVVILGDLTVEKIRFVTEIHHAVAHVVHPKVVIEETEEEEIEEELEGEGVAEDAESEEAKEKD